MIIYRYHLHGMVSRNEMYLWVYQCMYTVYTFVDAGSGGVFFSRYIVPCQMGTPIVPYTVVFWKIFVIYMCLLWLLITVRWIEEKYNFGENNPRPFRLIILISGVGGCGCGCGYGCGCGCGGCCCCCCCCCCSLVALVALVFVVTLGTIAMAKSPCLACSITWL